MPDLMPTIFLGHGNPMNAVAKNVTPTVGSSVAIGCTKQTERRTIMAEIKWITSFKDGLARVKTENKLALVDFFNPG